MSAIIDAHHHLWPLEAIPEQTWRPSDDGRLRRAFETAEFAGLRTASRVHGSILMQSVDGVGENARLLARAHADPRIVGVVAWAPFADPVRARSTIDETVRDAERWGVRERLVGFRCLIGRDPLDWLNSTESVEVFNHMAKAGFVWDVVPITVEQRRAVRRIADQLPDLKIVVDHLAAPPVDDDWAAWEHGIDELSRAENIAIKLSIGVAVLEASGEWTPAVLDRASSYVLKAFGAHRCMAASNWPVIELRAPYERIWRDLCEIVRRECSYGEAEGVLGKTALEWYGCWELQK